MNKKQKVLTYTALLLLVAALGACGGGGSSPVSSSSGGASGSSSSSSGGEAAGSSSSGGGNTPAAAKIQYEMPEGSAAVIADNLAQIDSQRQRGFRFVDTYNFSDSRAFYNLYVNDGSGSFSYEALEIDVASKGTLEGSLARRNAEGARGYRYISTIGSFNSKDIYEKKDSDTAAYAYRVFSPVPDVQSDFETQLATQAAEGFLFYFSYRSSPLSVPPSEAIYVQSSDFASVHYVYKLTDSASSNTAFLAQLNTYGAQGYKYLDSEIFAGVSKDIYAKDPSQPASVFSYQSVSVEDASSSYLTQVNALGTQGYRFVRWLAFEGDPSSYLYGVNLSHCAGALCGTSNY